MPRKSRPWYWSSRDRWATTINGRRHVAPPNVVTEHEAWAWHAEVIADVTPKQVSRATLTVVAVLDAYAAWDAAGVESGSRRRMTAVSMLNCIQTIANTRVGSAKFGTLLMARVAPVHYESLVTAWRNAGYKPSYVANLAQKLKTIMNWATKETIDRTALIEVSPFKNCASPTVQSSGERYGDRLTAARWLRFVWRCKHKQRTQDAMFQRCLIHTGARPSELAWATWGDVQWDAMRDAAGNPMAVITRSDWKNSRKTGKTRRIFLPARLVRAMRRRGEWKEPGDLIFPTRRGREHKSQSVSNRTIWLRKKAEAAGVVLAERSGKAVTNYLWRHVAATDLIASGVPIAVVAELLGTSVQQIAATYAHLLTDHLARASEKLGKRR